MGLRPALGAGLEHGQGLHVEGTHAPHEGLLHGLLVAVPLHPQLLDLALGVLHGVAVLRTQGRGSPQHGHDGTTTFPPPLKEVPYSPASRVKCAALCAEKHCVGLCR